jgi:AcrR family transcriptional regulator
MDRPELIVRSAQTLFSQFGLKKVTTDDIAREAHVSKATVYKHFKNKSDIFDRVIEDEAGALHNAIERAVLDQPDTIGKLRAHLTIRLDQVRRFVNFYRVTQNSWADYWPHIARIRKDFLRKEQDLVAGVLDAGVLSGEIQVRDTRKAALVLILALASAEYQWSLEENHFDLTELIDMMLEMIIEGIRKR